MVLIGSVPKDVQSQKKMSDETQRMLADLEVVFTEMKVCSHTFQFTSNFTPADRLKFMSRFNDPRIETVGNTIRWGSCTSLWFRLKESKYFP